VTDPTMPSTCASTELSAASRKRNGNLSPDQLELQRERDCAGTVMADRAVIEEVAALADLLESLPDAPASADG
jgi:hypothetical protein